MNVLIAYDASDGAKEALKFAMKLKCAVDKYYIVYVIPPIGGISASYEPYIPASVYRAQDKTAGEILRKAKRVVDKENVQYQIMKMNTSGTPIAKVILDTAEEEDVDLIVSGTRKLHAFTKLILGSVSSVIVAHAEIPVAVVPPKP